ncbi:hypothetical protein M0802_007975 [Mischocyttarus mexicanus]|nr:hypothetical protein M0802_007975 [Mischocyttarus mexicanus]
MVTILPNCKIERAKEFVLNRLLQIPLMRRAERKNTKRDDVEKSDNFRERHTKAAPKVGRRVRATGGSGEVGE